MFSSLGVTVTYCDKRKLFLNLKCLENQVLDLSVLHLMVQELKEQKSSACKFIQSTGQQQEFQEVTGHLSMFCKYDEEFLSQLYVSYHVFFQPQAIVSSIQR